MPFSSINSKSSSGTYAREEPYQREDRPVAIKRKPIAPATIDAPTHLPNEKSTAMLRHILGKPKEGGGRPRPDREISDSERQMMEKCRRAVSRLEELKINFLALDFDLTTIDVHTGGKWEGTTDELVSHIRPIFARLILDTHAAGIAIAIVTFSPQTRRITEVLERAFPEFGGSIPIRGRDRSWTYEGQGSKEGKQHHMASAAEELMGSRPGVHITKDSTLLIDDDANNVRIALHDHVRAVWLNPNRHHRVLDDIGRMS